ncbi:MAG: hypothetical protein H7840_06270 [Alphaproteobacteria bacterium]
MTHSHRLRPRIGQHGLAIVALAGMTLLLCTVFDAAGYSGIHVALMDNHSADESLERTWARALLIHPSLR